jgi:hypothetical protein
MLHLDHPVRFFGLLLMLTEKVCSLCGVGGRTVDQLKLLPTMFILCITGLYVVRMHRMKHPYTVFWTTLWKVVILRPQT